jgi:hypothetical protein
MRTSSRPRFRFYNLCIPPFRSTSSHLNSFSPVPFYLLRLQLCATFHFLRPSTIFCAMLAERVHSFAVSVICFSYIVYVINPMKFQSHTT